MHGDLSEEKKKAEYIYSQKQKSSSLNYLMVVMQINKRREIQG